jgi:hypothetical protein
MEIRVFSLCRQRLVQALFSCLFLALLLSGCTGAGRYSRGLPPIFSQEELSRPYAKVGQLTVSRERYGAPEDLTPADYDWAYHALRTEAARIDADGIILPEVKVQNATYIFFPSSEISAQATAIRFR